MAKTYKITLTAQELDVLESGLLKAAVWYADESTTYGKVNAERKDYFEMRFDIAENLLGRVVELMETAKKK